MKHSILSIDIETYSDVDLTKCGVYAYTDSPNFEVLLFGYAFDDEPVQVIDFASGQHLPDEVAAALTAPSQRLPSTHLLSVCVWGGTWILLYRQISGTARLPKPCSSAYPSP